MLKSLYTGVSGIKANQTKLDVIGNNVTNVGTTGFKKASTRFSDTLYQSQSFTIGPSNKYGGSNSIQVGLGTKVAGIVTDTNQGSLQLTGRTTDLAMDGDGYFVVATGSGTPNDPYILSYTRDGSFTIDKNGDLVTLDGHRVMGKDVDTNGDPIGDLKPINIPTTINGLGVVDFTVSVDKNGMVNLVLDDGSQINHGMLEAVVFPNPESLNAVGSGRFKPSTNTGTPLYLTDGDSAVFGRVTQGAIEMSNVDISEEFTEMIVTTRAFQSASKLVTTSDELLQEIINLKR